MSLWIWLLLVFPPKVFAIDPSEYLSELHHTQWTSREGAPSGISAMAQTSDGYLWLAAETGLYRFDGQRFALYRKPSDGAPIIGDVSAVYAKSNELWVGMRTGGAYFISNGQIKHYGKSEGLPDSSIFNFAVRYDGSVWAQGTGGLYHWDGRLWQRVGEDWGYPEKGYALFAANDGTLWARSSQGTFYLPRDATKFVKSDKPGGSGWIFTGPHGDPWVSDQDLGLVALTGAPRRVDGKVLRGDDEGTGNSAFDRDGGLWTQTISKHGEWNIVRIPNAGTILAASDKLRPEDIQVLAQSQSKIDGAAYAMMEDREGNIWIAGLGSLDRFRPNKMHSAFETSGTVPQAAMALDANGSIWLANLTRALRFDPGVFIPIVYPLSAENEVEALWVDRDRTLWLGQYQKDLARYSDGSLRAVPPPANSKGLGAQSVARDSTGALWLSNVSDGLLLRDGDSWIGQDSWPELPHKTPVVLSPDDRGRLWIGYKGEQIAVMAGGHARVLGPEQGLNIDTVLAVAPCGERVWVGGTDNTQLYMNDRFWTLKRRGGLPFTAVSGIVQDDLGALWLNTGSGIWRIDPADVNEFLRDHQHAVAAELMNFEDGLRGTANQLRPIPTALRGGDGRLWFTTTVGAYWIDPKNIRRNKEPPAVLVEAIVVDGKLFGVNSAVLPKRTTSFEVDYTAPSLSIPARVRFRYRLLGIDKTWQDAGDRRQAYYTNVGPGPHQFEVTAANEDGVWSPSGAILQFSIARAYYQTIWFYAVCAAAVAMLLFQLYRLRVHRLQRQFQARASARMEERERIARELHDTLLQSTQGLIYLFQAFAARLAVVDPMRKDMEQALDRADSLLNEARDRVNDIRTSTPEANIVQAIDQIGQGIFVESTTRFSASTIGYPRPIDMRVVEDILRIAREAFFNARSHAAAQSVEAEVSYETECLRLTVRDDGRGIDSGMLNHGSKPGHFGLQGMRERAQRCGATLRVRTRVSGAGTEIELAIPGSIVYVNERRAPGWRLTRIFRS